MTTAVQRRRGTTTEHATFTGLEGEISVNTTKETLVVHDGATAGGFELARADGSNFIASNVDINGGTIDGTSVGASSASTGAFTSLSASGEITANGGIALGDNDKATFGAGDDLQIYHDGSDSYISDVGTGDLLIRGGADIKLQNGTGTRTYATFTNSGDAQIYHNNALKLATTATGIDVTGSVVADGLTVEASSNALIRVSDATNANQRLDLTHNSGNAKVISGNNGAYGAINLQAYNGTDTINRLGIAANGDISFYEDTGTTPKFFWDASAESLGIGTSLPYGLTHWQDSSTINLIATNYGADGQTNTTVMSLIGQARSYGNNIAKLASIDFKTDATSWFKGNITFNVASSDGTDPAITPLEAMRIDASGNVGIGTSSVDSLLHLSKASGGSIIRLENPDTGLSSSEIVGRIEFETQDNGGAGVNSYIQAVGQGSGGANQLEFGTGTSNSPSTRLVIDASGNVGIGTSSPAELVHAANTSSAGAVGFRAENSEGHVNLLTNGGGLQIETSASGTVATIDSSGNLMVGKTATGVTNVGIELRPNGLAAIVRDGETALYVGRHTDDGELVNFRKDSATVGEIGTRASYLTIGSGDTKLLFNSAANAVTPEGTSANSDALISLGRSTSRFTDLYLSGGVYLGGTGAANKLDDYEEGTYTADFYENGGSTLDVVTGRYTKVGNVCTVSVQSLGGTTGGTGVVRSNLPFAIEGSSSGSSVLAYSVSNGNMLSVLGFGGASYVEFVDTLGSIAAGDKMIGSDVTTNSRTYFTLTYRTT